MGGDKPIAVVIASIVVAVLVGLPAVIVAVFYLFASVYAIIAGSDFGSDTINVGAFLAGLVITTATGIMIMAGAVALIGRALSPKRERA